jgi:hypothetical protein
VILSSELIIAVGDVILAKVDHGIHWPGIVAGTTRVKLKMKFFNEEKM